MSALRFSGKLKIRLTWVAERGMYRCHIKPTNGLGRCMTIYVGTFAYPSHLSYAVNSSKGFDIAAHAALTIAYDDGYPVKLLANPVNIEPPKWEIKRKP